MLNGEERVFHLELFIKSVSNPLMRLKLQTWFVYILAMFFVVIAGLKLLSQTNATSSSDQATPSNPFSSNVKVTFTETSMIVESDGIPNHPTGPFPNPTNPNHIQKQQYKFVIPRNPKIAEKPTALPFGPIGVAVNGIPFYNPYNAEGKDAVMGPNAEIFDSCCGHPDQRGRYHYHKYPVCVKTPFSDPVGEHSPLIGYAFDGFAIYGPNGENGKPPTDLDDCNGHTDVIRGYHYHVTANFPYILGAYKGVVDENQFDHIRGGGLQHPRGRDHLL
jgi:hypothetical protein